MRWDLPATSPTGCCSSTAVSLSSRGRRSPYSTSRSMRGPRISCAACCIPCEVKLPHDSDPQSSRLAAEPLCGYCRRGGSDAAARRRQECLGGNNGGQLNPGLKLDPDAIEADFGTDLGRRMIAFAYNTPVFTLDLIRRLGI